MSSSPIVLVRSPIVSTERAINNEATPSVAFAYISGYLMKHGYDVLWVDAIAEGLGEVWPLKKYPGYQCQGITLEETIERIPTGTKVIGFSAMFSGEWPVLRDLIAMIRQRFPEALLVAGGEHITALTEYSMHDCPQLDVCVRGEGEESFRAVIEGYLAGTPWEEVAGDIAWRDADGSIKVSGGLPRIRDIDNIPWPHWPEGYLERFWAAGKSYGVHSDRDMPIMASRGCPYRCSFCSNPQMWTTRYILRDVDDVIAEIEHWRERYDITALQFYDLTAITKKKWAVEFCHKLIERGIDLKWSLPSGTRSEALDDEVLDLIKRTGCNYLVYAPESGSAETLQRIGKRIDLRKFTHSVLAAKRAGLILRTNLIIGFPGETPRQAARTILYGLYLAIRGVDEVSINIFSPYPGTQFFEELLAKDQVKISDSYFFYLTSLNSDYTQFAGFTVNEYMSGKQLAFLRIFFQLSNYGLSYLLRPWRLVRTIRNLLSENGAATVFEHRLKDMLRRRRREIS